MYEQSLIQTGLAEEMAQIYEYLLKNGPQVASKLAKKTGLKRGLTYKSLDRLLEKGLIEKKEEAGKVAVFSANHPLKLEEMVQTRKQKAANAELALGGVLSSLVSDYNLLTGRPGVVFYEGDEGIKKVIFDSLTTQGEIYQYIDNEAANSIFPEINFEYTKKRKELGIKKKMITLDSEFIKTNKDKYDPALSEIHLIDGKRFPFATAMQIYDDKVSYITMAKDKKIGIIIEDAYIAGMHKTIFEYMWEKTESLFASPTPINKQTPPPANSAIA